VAAHHHHNTRHAFAATAIALAASAPAAEFGGETAGGHNESPASQNTVSWKLTPTVYRSSAETNAWDLNLRGSLGPSNAWVGFYQRPNEFQQLRVGYDQTIDLPVGKLIPSVQYATRGFLGGSLNAELGERYFALLGFGRTNLKPYYNLNFDPNDAVTLGAGTRALPSTTLSVFQVRDDRLHTAQRITHAVARVKPDDKTRWTLDVFYKHGRPDADPASEFVHGTGLTVTYDFEPYFVRVASDPYVNFTHNHMMRVTVGTRF
jgi:hypothetical protein